MIADKVSPTLPPLPHQASTALEGEERRTCKKTEAQAPMALFESLPLFCEHQSDITK